MWQLSGHAWEVDLPSQRLLLTAAMPPRFGHSLPLPSMDELIHEERAKIRKRAAEDEAKAASLGGAGPALRCKVGHPMMIRPGSPCSSIAYNGVGADAGIMNPSSLMPGRAIRSQSSTLSSSPMLSLGAAGKNCAVASSHASSSSSCAPASSSLASPGHDVPTAVESSTAVVIYPGSSCTTSSAAMRGPVRSDKPTVKYKSRGDKKHGMKVASDPALLDAAIINFKKDTRSAGDTSEYNTKTWRDYHYGVDWGRLGEHAGCEPLPLTPTKITVIGAIMKEADYRSAKNYMSAMKADHIAGGHPWTDQLDLAASKFNISTTRGMGPGKQSEPLDFKKLVEVDINEVVSNPKYPVKPGFAVVLFSFFLLRELECACAQRGDMTLDRKGRTVTLKLSVSKNDPRAIGCTRSWGCVCDDIASPRSCPYHAAEALDDYIVETFPDAILDPAFPLFPDASGNEVSAFLMICLIEELAQRLGEELRNKAGKSRYGKHTWRATGAVHLGGCGLDVNKIALMGRWFCAVVLHYTRMSPITNIARDFKRARASDGIDDTVRTISINQKKTRDAVEGMMSNIKAEMAELQRRIEVVSRDSRPREVVVNRSTGKVHKVLTTMLDTGSEAVAACGFKYALCQKSFHSSIPAGTTRQKVCGTCFKVEREGLPR